MPSAPRRSTGSTVLCQAEDGIRYYKVTGVQTCALPIFRAGFAGGHAVFGDEDDLLGLGIGRGVHAISEHDPLARVVPRSGWVNSVPAAECRAVTARDRKSGRVGEECRSRWSPDH